MSKRQTRMYVVHPILGATSTKRGCMPATFISLKLGYNLQQNVAFKFSSIPRSNQGMSSCYNIRPTYKRMAYICLFQYFLGTFNRKTVLMKTLKALTYRSRSCKKNSDSQNNVFPLPSAQQAPEA